MLVAACTKWVDLRPEVDPVHGTVVATGRGGGFSAADHSAVEVALRLADAWDGEVVVICAGPVEAEDGLRELLAAGASRAVRIDVGDAHGDELGVHTGEGAAAQLGPVLRELRAEVVVCGDVSTDLGSGTVPAYLAHHLDAAQALGLLSVEVGERGRVRAVRRLDGGRREVLDVAAPAVLSVEGAVAELRRAPLSAALAARDAAVDVRMARPARAGDPPRLRPWRPPARAVAPPAGEHALDRVVQLTGALVDRTPPRTLELEPAAAAEAILEQLRTWGYLVPTPDAGGAGDRVDAVDG
ncbi:mycofactocin-associated electron transfer flavoprotein beta subunit [Dermatobacter hominis]|uniref:mycofactocin-associated electron transfer flavoprotein beta subunit n=1 Tax=Dermatobacter hominis TaxID=2884263 RepID=UPI001D12949B|nr:mycofactocin-associated electron transfer flavoprotein beta subunit [Dermatobacter hominis]UDY37761.1 mycofactocin-associated electron transfer flavoprotein beta subunit [Dermatobacter hominis]